MIKKLGVIVLVIALMSIIPVSAHEGVEHETRAEATAHARETLQNTRKTAICERAQIRLGRRLERSDEVEKRYLTRYQKVIDRLDNIVVRLEENESAADTSDISDDIDELNSLIQDFETNFAIYTAAMRAAVNIQCPTDGNTDEIRAAAADIRDAHKDVLSAAQDVRDYVAIDVVDHLQILRDELTNPTSTDDETEAEPRL